MQFLTVSVKDIWPILESILGPAYKALIIFFAIVLVLVIAKGLITLIASKHKDRQTKTERKPKK